MKTAVVVVSAFAAVVLSACLPRVEDPPLTVTGEAPVGWSPAKPGSLAGDAGVGADAGTTTAPTGKCAGNAPDLATAAKNKMYPCSITNLDLTLPTAGPNMSFGALVTGAGNFKVSNAYQLAYFKQLKQIGNFHAENFNDDKLFLPDPVVVSESITIYGKMQYINGFLGVGQLSSSLLIANCSNLTQVSGFTNLIKAASIEIRGAPKLTSLAAFSKLNQIQSFAISDVQAANVALPVLPATYVNHIDIKNFAGISQIQMFINVTLVGNLTVQQMPTLFRVDMPKLGKISVLNLIDVGKMVNLDGFGPVQVSGGLTVCGSGVPGATLEAWRQQHAPNLQFSKCPSGCTGGECP